jgi:osmoprotectant transport system permease protein
MGSDSFSAAAALLPEYLGQHVLLSMSAIALGTTVSLPLGIACAQSRSFRGPILGAAGVLQTIPGLALLALFYPVLLALSSFTVRAFGLRIPALGFLPALLALSVYSMLPILRNTVTGLLTLDPNVTTAARAVGMTPWQSLKLVEMPLAAPVIMSGIRIAAVWVIGTATLSTPVGQASLGNYIFTGLQTENWSFVLFGCVAAGLLALIVDRLLALAESGFARRSGRRIIAAVVSTSALVACAISPLFAVGTPALVIGAKNFNEQYTLSALFADRLDKAGLPSVQRNNLGSTIIFHALAANDIDLYVDYSGTLWANELHRGDTVPRQKMLGEISFWLRSKYGIRDLGPLGFENAYVLAMPKEKARALGIRTLADLQSRSSQMKIGGDYEFFSRPEWASVIDKYHLHFQAQRTYQATFMYRALRDGDVDIIAAFSSDGRIMEYNLALLADPKSALPAYDAILLLAPRRTKDERLSAALMPLIGNIRLPLMQRANSMVDRDKRAPEDVAKWLDKQIPH